VRVRPRFRFGSRIAHSCSTGANSALFRCVWSSRWRIGVQPPNGCRQSSALAEAAPRSPLADADAVCRRVDRGFCQVGNELLCTRRLPRRRRTSPFRLSRQSATCPFDYMRWRFRSTLQTRLASRRHQMKLFSVSGRPAFVALIGIQQNRVTHIRNQFCSNFREHCSRKMFGGALEFEASFPPPDLLARQSRDCRPRSRYGPSLAANRRYSEYSTTYACSITGAVLRPLRSLGHSSQTSGCRRCGPASPPFHHLFGAGPWTRSTKLIVGPFTQDCGLSGDPSIKLVIARFCLL